MPMLFPKLHIPETPECATEIAMPATHIQGFQDGEETIRAISASGRALNEKQSRRRLSPIRQPLAEHH